MYKTNHWENKITFNTIMTLLKSQEFRNYIDEFQNYKKELEILEELKKIKQAVDDLDSTKNKIVELKNKISMIDQQIKIFNLSNVLNIDFLEKNKIKKIKQKENEKKIISEQIKYFNFVISNLQSKIAKQQFCDPSNISKDFLIKNISKIEKKEKLLKIKKNELHKLILDKYFQSINFEVINNNTNNFQILEKIDTKNYYLWTQKMIEKCENLNNPSLNEEISILKSVIKNLLKFEHAEQEEYLTRRNNSFKWNQIFCVCYPKKNRPHFSFSTLSTSDDDSTDSSLSSSNEWSDVNLNSEDKVYIMEKIKLSPTNNNSKTVYLKSLNEDSLYNTSVKEKTKIIENDPMNQYYDDYCKEQKINISNNPKL